MPAMLGYSLICLKKLAVPCSFIDVAQGRNRFLKGVVISMFMAFKLFASRRNEKRRSIKKELAPFADLLEKDKWGNVQLILKKEAKKRVGKIRDTVAVKKEEIEDEIEGCNALAPPTPLWAKILAGGLVAETITCLAVQDNFTPLRDSYDHLHYQIANIVISSAAIAIAAAIGTYMMWLWHRVEKADFIERLKALAPKIREGMGKE
jgi:hypothetical protein